MLYSIQTTHGTWRISVLSQEYSSIGDGTEHSHQAAEQAAAALQHAVDQTRLYAILMTPNASG
jgi:hypothetical protein